MSDLFVSYKAEDRRRVEPLVLALEADGFSVWWDAQIGGGDRWRESILQNLDAAKCVIVVWSRRSTGPEGEFVRDEATRAQRRNAYLPVRIDKVEPPLGFGETQVLSLSGWKGNRSDPRYQHVLEAIRTRSGLEHRHHSDASAPVWSRRSALVAGGGAVVIGGAGAARWFWSRTAAGGHSIAVLPFANLSGDPAQAYFSDGIAEELRSALARVSGLKVVARTSSEAVRNEDAKTAARALHVANILTGSVRRSANLLRISAQLIDGEDGTERWSDQYDRPVGDALQIQSDIARRVTSALALRLVPAAGGRLTVGGTTDAQAYDLYLRALAARQSGYAVGNLSRAITLLDAALRVDPQYADAYALKAIALGELTSGFSSNGPDVQRGLTQAEAAARRALSLSPDLPVAHAALAEVATNQIDFARALAEYRKAAAGSSDALILGDYGRFMGQIGFSDDAHRIAKRVIALDPLNSRSYSVDAAAFYSSRQFANAIIQTRKALSLSPGLTVALVQVGDSFLNLGRYEEARQTYAQVPPTDVFRLTSEGILNERLGNHAGSKLALDNVMRMFGSAASYQLAQLYAQRREISDAFSALEQAVELPDAGLISLLVDPFLDPLREDRRFRVMKNRIKFPAGLG